jgi:hypothetical protein
MQSAPQTRDPLTLLQVEAMAALIDRKLYRHSRTRPQQGHWLLDDARRLQQRLIDAGLATLQPRDGAHPATLTMYGIQASGLPLSDEPFDLLGGWFLAATSIVLNAAHDARATRHPTQGAA